MASGEARPARGGKRAGDEAQGSLEGLLPPEEPSVKKSSRAPRVQAVENGPDPLLASLDALEENVTLLLARLESLTAANAAAEERRRSRDSLDPEELDRRLRALESDKERLELHAAFLERRIRGLLSRVRYVIES
jgi:hypothetical protein